MVIDFNDEQFQNAYFPILFNLDPFSKWMDSITQLRNALSPISSTDAGMIIDFNDTALKNVSFPILLSLESCSKSMEST